MANDTTAQRKPDQPRKPDQRAARPQTTAAAGRGAARTPAAPIARAKSRRKVIATQMGYYGLVRRREGDVFTLAAPIDFNPKWMADVDAYTPERTTTGQEALQQQREEVLSSKFADGAAGGPTSHPTDDPIGD